MPKFTVFATERVYYAFEVEADNEEQASEEAHKYGPSFDDVWEADNFEIQTIQEI